MSAPGSDLGSGLRIVPVDPEDARSFDPWYDVYLAAERAVGTTGYPFIMFVDADGNLMFRISAELPIEDVQTLADQAAATAAT